jgi:hypothetical protein
LTCSLPLARRAVESTEAARNLLGAYVGTVVCDDYGEAFFLLSAALR